MDIETTIFSEVVYKPFFGHIKSFCCKDTNVIMLVLEMKNAIFNNVKNLDLF